MKTILKLQKRGFMTDKQIIFGVDVSKCPYAEPAYGSPKCRINGYVHCDGFRNCEYKQLKRKKQRIVELNKTIKAKEQECERLKHDNGYEVGALERTIDNLKAENEALKKAIEYDSRYNDLQAEIDCGETIINQLKAENDELKVQNIKYMNGNIGYQLKNSLYKQTLTEIKEIAEKRDYLDYGECLDDILQKISEVIE